MAKKVKKIGFAALSKEARAKIAKKGGKASAAKRKAVTAPVVATKKIAKKTVKKTTKK